MHAAQRTTLCILFSLLSTVGCTCPGPEDRRIANAWLLTDCSRDAELAIAAQIHGRGNAIVSVFEDAFEDGPTAVLTRRYTKAALAQYRRTRLAPRTTDTMVFAKKAGQAFLDSSIAIGADSVRFETMIRGDLIRAYRSRALVGMGLVGSRRARRYLATVAAGPAPYNVNAKAILKLMPPNGPLTITP